MWRNYWTVAVRALAKSKTYSIINIAGLAIGMAACVMILLYIHYERSYDDWLPDVENTTSSRPGIRIRQDGEPSFMQMSAYVTKDRVKKDFPQVAACGLRPGQRARLHQGRPGDVDEGLLVRGRRFPEGRQPAAGGRRELTAPRNGGADPEEAIKRFGTDQVVGQDADHHLAAA